MYMHEVYVPLIKT